MSKARMQKGSPKINIGLADVATEKALRIILAYESGIRGRAAGQTAYELVMQAIDIESYPPEVRKRLDELQDDVRKRAIERSLNLDADEELDTGQKKPD